MTFTPFTFLLSCIYPVRRSPWPLLLPLAIFAPKEPTGKTFTTLYLLHIAKWTKKGYFVSVDLMISLDEVVD